MRSTLSLFAALFVSGLVQAKDVTEIVIRQTNLDEEIARVCSEYCQGNQRKGSLRKVEVFDIGNNSAIVKIYASLLNQHNTGPVFGIAEGVGYTHTIEVIATGTIDLQTCRIKVKSIDFQNDIYGLGELTKGERGKIYIVENCNGLI
jgi:hypothetical protein